MLAAFKFAYEGWEGGKAHGVLETWLAGSFGAQADDALVRELVAADAEIREMWDDVCLRRQETEGSGGGLSLLYFQYLAALASEVYLRRFARAPSQLLQEINEGRGGREKIPDVAALNKLAFWMATGSGKTLLMHLHYKMFLRHVQGADGGAGEGVFLPDNVVLVSPNEELSRQHVAEMRLSGIPCFRHGERGLFADARYAVRVVEITKLLREGGKRGRGGGGSGVWVEAFEGRNLVFVDEGHKGAGGEEWFAVRDGLVRRGGGRDGFVFEYSATFGQALDARLLGPGRVAANKTEAQRRAREYARCILVDYSYRYFYGDGYGKDFLTVGVGGSEENADAERLLLLGNLLAFFGQLLAFERQGEALAAYLIDKPLLLLLGGRVVAGRAGKVSDLLKLLRFLAAVASDREDWLAAPRARGGEGGGAWLARDVARLWKGESGLGDAEEGDLFAGRFESVRAAFGGDAAAAAAELRRLVCGTAAAGVLRLSVLRRAPGEIALRVGEAAPFGVVAVGESRKLAEMARADGMAVDEDAVGGALFAGAHGGDSDVTVLLGAKKFMEGWSSWRVCSMGLVDIGRREGVQIIQLFGRGVRLRGLGFSLKRGGGGGAAAAGEGEGGEALRALQTLNVFAIRAEFMGQFRAYLQEEGVAAAAEREVAIRFNPAVYAEAGLQMLRFPRAADFDEAVLLQAREGVRVTVDYAVRTQRLAGAEGAVFAEAGGEAAAPAAFPAPVVAALDFGALRCRLLEWARARETEGMVVGEAAALRAILVGYCRVAGGAALFEVRSAAALRRVEEAAFAALCKYAETLYFRRLRRWEAKAVGVAPLFDEAGAPAAAMRGNFVDYKLRLTHGDAARRARQLADIDRLLADGDVLYKCENRDALPRLNFARHLYVPLLLAPAAGIEVSPPALNEGEREFVEKLRAFLAGAGGEGGVRERVFLLRNQGRGRGVGFFEDEGFYPDFILWVKAAAEGGGGGGQRVVFVEPHGMLHAPAYAVDFKARLWEHLGELSRRLGEAGRRGVVLDSFVISRTPFEELRRRYGEGDWTREAFAARHIVFAEEAYVGRILGGEDGGDGGGL